MASFTTADGPSPQTAPFPLGADAMPVERLTRRTCGDLGHGCRNSLRRTAPQAVEALLHLPLGLPKGTGSLVGSAQLHVFLSLPSSTPSCPV